MLMSKNFKMNVNVTYYSNIIVKVFHRIYAVIFFGVYLKLQYYSVHVYYISKHCYMSDCCHCATIIPYIVYSR